MAASKVTDFGADCGGCYKDTSRKDGIGSGGGVFGAGRFSLLRPRKKTKKKKHFCGEIRVWWPDLNGAAQKWFPVCEVTSPTRKMWPRWW